ncbi:hypothetical protein [Streptomyces inusitatus]|nr:hypothetical protein [Streptomyces inusitatus]
MFSATFSAIDTIGRARLDSTPQEVKRQWDPGYTKRDDLLSVLTAGRLHL